jgi:hypothetical protein
MPLGPRSRATQGVIHLVLSQGWSIVHANGLELGSMRFRPTGFPARRCTRELKEGGKGGITTPMSRGGPRKKCSRCPHISDTHYLFYF